MKAVSNRIYYALYALAALCLWPFVDAYVNNPDSFQYLNIARQLLEAQFGEFVNGYWSPLISWLLAPLLLTGVHPVLLFKALQLVIGLFGLSTWCNGLDQLHASSRISSYSKLAAIPLFLSWALLTLTADLLFVVLALRLVLFFVDHPVWNDNRRSLRAGILGGVLFLSKSIGLPFFLLFSLITYYHHRKTTTSSSWKNFMIAMAMFFSISGLWITMISIKYGHVTISEAADFNFTREVYSKPGEIVRLPILYEKGVIAPAGEHALSAWEEPMRAKQLHTLDLFKDETDNRYWVDNTVRNFLSIWYFDFRRQAGLFFLILLALSFFSKVKPDWRDQRFLYPVVGMLLIYIGYGLILFHARYSWLCLLLFIYSSAYLITRMSDPFFIRVSHLVFVVLVFVSIKRPVKEFLFAEDKDVTMSGLFHALSHPAATMRTTYADDRQVFDAVEQIGCMDGPFVSRFSEGGERPRYFSSLLLANRSGQRYFGQIDDRDSAAIASAKESGVSYLVVWDEKELIAENAKLICETPFLQVYKLYGSTAAKTVHDLPGQ